MVMDKVVLFAATLLLVFLSSSAWTAGDEMWKRTLSALDIPGATTTMGRPSIKGSGSLVSQNLMAAYVHNLTIDSGNNFGYIYDPVTDVQGQENFIGNTYDFAISDVALLPTQLAQCNREVMQIPFAINGAAAVYNLSGYKTGEIILDAKTLAGIFQCEITYWNDTSIALLNNNTRLPAQLIYPVALYAPASATWLLTSYLTALAPGSWLGGPAKVLPWAPCVKRAGSTADVLSYLANTSYAIGVVQHLFADQQGLTYAAVQNKAGNFVLPNITSSYSDIAFPTSTKSHAWVDVSLSQSNDSSAYPLSGLEFCFVNQFDRHMGYPNGEMLKNLTFNLLDPLFQALLPHYGFSSVMPQILHLKSEQDIMTAETSPTDNTVDPVQTNPGDLHTNPPTNTGWRVQILEGTLIGAAAFLVLLGLAAGLVWRRKHAPQETITKEGRRNSSQALDKRLTGGSLQTVDELQFQYDASGCRICLGKGSYGAVYKARWKGTLVAVKVLTSHDEAQRQEFEREVALLELLRHSHIVNYLGHIFGANDQMMLITELMHGGDLGKRIHEEEGPDRKFGWYRAGASIALSIARGLTYLHSMNIVWFDCKPSNVLLDHSGYVAKIADVGLSRMLAGSGTDTVLRGTFDYMAPELFASYTNDDESQEVHHPITMAADIYSFGLVLWELIMKERPRRPSGTVRRLKPRVPKDCPQKIVDLYLKCLATDPKARPKAEVVMETIAASMVG